MVVLKLIRQKNHCDLRQMRPFQIKDCIDLLIKRMQSGEYQSDEETVDSDCDNSNGDIKLTRGLIIRLSQFLSVVTKLSTLPKHDLNFGIELQAVVDNYIEQE